MDKRLHELDTFTATGSDGRHYRVHAFEHLGRVQTFTAGETWEPMGVSELKLDDGRHVDVLPDGRMVVAGTDLHLMDERRH